MMKPENSIKPSRSKLTILAALVLFVFVILLISVSIAGIALFLMSRFGLMQPLSAGRLPFILLFMLVISLVISIILSTLAGNVSLRPLRKFIDATKEIAAGNFSVRVSARGPEEYKRLVSSFNDMAEELGGIETLRDDFVSSISHEYKTPIVSIRGFAKLMKKGNLSKQQQDEYLDIIISESDRLVQMSSNVLLLSKLNTAGKPQEMETFSLDEQIRRVLLVLNQQMEDKQLDLEIALEPCQITANQELFQQVWMNLLGNAVKFTPQGGRIAVALTTGRNCTCVSVSDTGIGISEAAQKHVFDKFYQGDRSRLAEGNGLGLSLVKRIVELHGGTVAVRSTLGEGATFTVELPNALNE